MTDYAKVTECLVAWADSSDMGRKPDPESIPRQAADAIESLIAERDAYQQAADKMAAEHKVEREALERQIKIKDGEAEMYKSYWNKATAKNRQMVARMEALARIVMADQVAHDLPEIKSPKPLYQLITEENVRWLDEQEKTLNGENTCSQNSTT